MRLRGIVRGLARTNSVSLVAFGSHARESPADLAEAEAMCDEVVLVPGDRVGLSRARKRALQVRSLLSTASFERLVHERPVVQAAIDRLARKSAFDVVHVETSLMANFAFPPDVPVVLDEQNIEYEILRRTVTVAGAPPRRLYSYVDHLKLRAEEQRAWQTVDACAVASPRDEDTIRRVFPSALTAVVPNAVDTEYFAPTDDRPERQTLLFFGTMGYHPNVDAMLSFLRDALPLVKRTHPGARLVIVGSSPPREIQQWAGPDVIVAGAVDDVRPYLSRARVVIVPLRIGGGTRLKILEAMAMRKAVVSTSLGAEGLDVTDGRELLIADGAHAFAASVAEVLDDDDLTDRLGSAARQLVETRYDWSASVRALEGLYAAAIGGWPSKRSARATA